MSLLLKLSINNIRKNLRESVLVVISVSLILSMLTLVSISMFSAYKMVENMFASNLSAHVNVNNIKDPFKLIEDINTDNLENYQISVSGYQFDDEKYFFGINGIYTDNTNSLPNNWTRTEKLVKGRTSQNENEVVLYKGAGFDVGDQVTVNVQTQNTDENQPTRKEVLVVGLSSDEYNQFFKLNRGYKFPDEEQYKYVELIFKEDVHNYKEIVKEAVENQGYSYKHDVYIDQDYNFFVGLDRKPGLVLYMFIVMTSVMLLAVFITTFSLVLNAFNISLSQKHQTLGILRSVGATKQQIKKIIYFEGFTMAILGIGLGVGLGVLIADFLGNYITYILNSVMKKAAVDGVELTFNMIQPAWLLGLVALVGVVAILIVHFKLIHGLFKQSSVTTIQNAQLKKTYRTKKIEKKPMRGLARISTKSNKDYHGIRVAYMMTVILVIVIAQWTASTTELTDKKTKKYDTSLHYETRVDSELFSDFASIDDVLSSNETVLEYSRILSAQPILIDNNSYFTDLYLKKPRQNQGEDYNYFYLISFDDETFNRLSKSNGFNKEDNGVVIYDKGNESEPTFKLKAGETIEVKFSENSNFQNLSILTISSGLDEWKALSPYESDIYMIVSETTSRKLHQEAYGQEYLNPWVEYRIQTKLEEDGIAHLRTELKDLEITGRIDLNSDFVGMAAQKQIRDAVNVVTLSIFTYFSIIILINVINVSLTNYQNRKRDIAILRTVGASKKQIKNMFIWEALYTMLGPILMGVVIGYLINGCVVFYFKYRYSVDILKVQWNPMILMFILGLTIISIIIEVLSVSIENKKQDMIDDIKGI